MARIRAGRKGSAPQCCTPHPPAPAHYTCPPIPAVDLLPLLPNLHALPSPPQLPLRPIAGALGHCLRRGRARGKVHSLPSPPSPPLPNPSQPHRHPCAVPLGIVCGANVTLGKFITTNLIPVTLGNIFAGVVLVATAYSLLYGSLGKKITGEK